MRKHRVEITRIAESDIQEIFDYISRDNKASAIKWVEEIEQQIDSLENFTLRCPIIPEAQELGEKYRHLIYGNYRTIFRIEGSRVIIMRVIHSAQLLDLQTFEK
ncbi:MAG TPA: type II toxin-antitoxin system RelE/ParE family toxin [Candidatus Brocadiales bacterium]|nr:type II toxin-antitoxin system RelE/ParE family toxin [Candidatus Brocadiales bacterium]